MNVDIEPLEFARLMFDAKIKLKRSEGHHGPDERCANCDHHEVCCWKSNYLVPWETLPTDVRSEMLGGAQAILWALEKRAEAAEGYDKREARITELTKEKNGAYTERNRVVALLAKAYPSSLERNPTEIEVKDGWGWIVYIELPSGQVSWHIIDDELPRFSHVKRESGAKWDGHTTEEKYKRVEEAAKS